MSDCEYCFDVGVGTYCDVEDPESGFVCTRETGHEGPHVACSPPNHELAEWTDEPEAEVV